MAETEHVEPSVEEVQRMVFVTKRQSLFCGIPMVPLGWKELRAARHAARNCHHETESVGGKFAATAFRNPVLKAALSLGAK